MKLKNCIFIILLSVIFYSSNAAAEENTEQKKNTDTETLKIAHKFDSKEDMDSFIFLYQQKLAVENRIAVLKQYLEAENANLENVNARLLLKYRIDSKKNYQLNPEKGHIIEVEQNK
jgi:hypothetical protein